MAITVNGRKIDRRRRKPINDERFRTVANDDSYRVAANDESYRMAANDSRYSKNSTKASSSSTRSSPSPKTTSSSSAPAPTPKTIDNVLKASSNSGAINPPNYYGDGERLYRTAQTNIVRPKPNFVTVGKPYGPNYVRNYRGSTNLPVNTNASSAVTSANPIKGELVQNVGYPRQTGLSTDVRYPTFNGEFSEKFPVTNYKGTSVVPVSEVSTVPNFTLEGEPYGSEPNFRTVGKPYTPTSLPAEYVGTDVTPYSVNNTTASAAQRGLFEKWFPRLAVAGETYGYFNPDDLEAIANGVNPDDIHLNTNKIANSMAGGGIFGAGLGALQGALAGTGAGAGALGGLAAGATAGLGLGAAGLGGYALGRAVDNATGGALSSGMSRASDWATGLDEVYDNQKKALTSSATTPEYLRQVKWLNQRNDLMKKYGISRMEANDIMEGRRQLPSTTTTTSEETTSTNVDTSAPAQEATVESAATTSTTPATSSTSTLTTTPATTTTPTPAKRRRVQAASPMETAIATPSPREQLMAKRAAALEAARIQQQQAAAQYAALNAPKPGFNPSGYATGHEAYYDPYKSQLLFR